MPSSEMEVEGNGRMPKCLYEFVYLSFHQQARTGEMVPPCTLRLYDNLEVAFLGIGGISSGIHGSYEFKCCPIQPTFFAELEVFFHWNGNPSKGKMHFFQKCPGYHTLWQTVPDNLAGAVVLVEKKLTA